MSVAADVIVSADVDAATDDTFDEGPQLLERLGGGIGMLFFFFSRPDACCLYVASGW